MSYVSIFHIIEIVAFMLALLLRKVLPSIIRNTIFFYFKSFRIFFLD